MSNAHVIDPTVMDISGDRWDSRNADELCWWPRCLWVDPGVVTGLTMLWYDPEALLAQKQPTPRCVLAWQEMYVRGPENEQIDQILALARMLEGDEKGFVIGCETFILQKMNMSNDLLAPVRLRSKLEYGVHMWQKNRRIALQSPSEALTAVNDNRLKLWNMYTPGPDHIRDSTRHALLWMRKFRQIKNGGLAFKQWHGWESGWLTSGNG